MPATAAPAVEFFFDPICAWTWLTSRWLVDVAAQTGVEIRWHSLSLGLLRSDSLEPTSDTRNHLRPLVPLSTKALRIVEHLAAQDRNAEIGCFYTALGTALHVEKGEPTDALLADALTAAGLADAEPFSTNHDLDASIRASHERSQSLVVGDSGSPVLSIDGRAVFGPIVSPAPTGADALMLWEAVRTLASMPAFFELKRNREAPPQTS